MHGCKQRSRGTHTGFMAYSEGVSDDANKAILAGISSGKFASARDVLACYAERYFGAEGQAQADWAEWLWQWGRPFEVDVAAAAKSLEKLSREVGCRGLPSHRDGNHATAPHPLDRNWRLEAWRQRVRIFEAHRDVLAAAKWDENRLAAARRFLAEQERLYREVWKLGLVRHALHPRYRRPTWFAEYEQTCGGTSGGAKAGKEA